MLIIQPFFTSVGSDEIIFKDIASIALRNLKMRITFNVHDKIWFRRVWNFSWNLWQKFMRFTFHLSIYQSSFLQFKKDASRLEMCCLDQDLYQSWRICMYFKTLKRSCECKYRSNIFYLTSFVVRNVSQFPSLSYETQQHAFETVTRWKTYNIAKTCSYLEGWGLFSE